MIRDVPRVSCGARQEAVTAPPSSLDFIFFTMNICEKNWYQEKYILTKILETKYSTLQKKMGVKLKYYRKLLLILKKRVGA